MGVLRRARSALSLVLALSCFIPGFLYMYLFVVPASALFPRRAQEYRMGFIKGMARVLLASLRVGGAQFQFGGRIPTDGPCIVIGNHQSLVDPAVLIAMAGPFVPAFVARKRYASVPVVGRAMRWVGCPIIDPTRDARGAVTALAAGAARLEHGILIFPEGHRTLDGEMRPFRTSGLVAMLTTRRMPVYLAVTDGLWVNRTLADLVWNVYRMQGRTDVLGPFAPPADDAAIPAFVEELQDRMVAHLAQMRKRDEYAA
jgi:1-acyl-sn-glycerol-3-phosphate acyltransferase